MSSETGRGPADTDPTTTTLGPGLIPAALVVAALLLAASWIRFLSMPYGDDPSFLRIAQTWIRHGRLESVGWNDPSLLSQLAYSKTVSPILGSSVTGLRLGLLPWTLLGLLAIGALFRSTGCRLWPLGVVLFVAVPVVLSSLPVYTTDLFATSWVVVGVCLAISGGRAQQRERRWLPWFIGACTCVAIAALSRQSALPTLVALPLAYSWTLSTRRERRWLVAAPAATSIVCLAAFAVNPITAETGPAIPFVAPLLMTSGLVRLVTTVGLAVFPLLVVQLPALWRWFFSPRIPPMWRVAVLAVIGIYGAACGVVAGRYGTIFLPDSIGPTGGRTVDASHAPQFVVAWVWGPVTLLGVLGGALLVVLALRVLQAMAIPPATQVVAAVRRAAPTDRVMAMLGAVCAATFLAASLLRGTAFSRYALLTIVAVIYFLLRGAPLRSTSLVPALLTAMIVAIAFAWTVDLYLFQRSLWDAGDGVVAQGAEPQSVFAGFGWTLYRYRGTVVPVSESRDPGPFYERRLPDYRPCTVVTTERAARPGWTLLGTRHVPQLLPGVPRTLWIFENGTCTDE